MRKQIKAAQTKVHAIVAKHDAIIARSHHWGHLVFYAALAFGASDFREYIAGVALFIEAIAVLSGSDTLRDAVVEFE